MGHSGPRLRGLFGDELFQTLCKPRHGGEHLGSEVQLPALQRALERGDKTAFLVANAGRGLVVGGGGAAGDVPLGEGHQRLARQLAGSRAGVRPRSVEQVSQFTVAAFGDQLYGTDPRGGTRPFDRGA